MAESCWHMPVTKFLHDGRAFWRSLHHNLQLSGNYILRKSIPELLPKVTMLSRVAEIVPHLFVQALQTCGTNHVGLQEHNMTH